jgi:hypothetical protein
MSIPNRALWPECLNDRRQGWPFFVPNTVRLDLASRIIFPGREAWRPVHAVRPKCLDHHCLEKNGADSSSLGTVSPPQNICRG